MGFAIKCAAGCYDFAMKFSPSAMKNNLLDGIDSLARFPLLEGPVSAIVRQLFKDDPQEKLFMMQTAASYMTSHVIVVIAAAAISTLYATTIPILAVTAAVIGLYAVIDLKHVVSAVKYAKNPENHPQNSQGSFQYVFYGRLKDLRPKSY